MKLHSQHSQMSYVLNKTSHRCIIHISLICFPQRKEAVFFSACSCGHGERRFALYSQREVKPSGRAGAEPVGGVQKDQHMCWKPSCAHAALTSVPQQMSHSALLWVRICVISHLCSICVHKSQRQCSIYSGFTELGHA